MDFPINDLLERLAADPAFAGVDLTRALDGTGFIGRAPEQVDEFISDVVAPIRSDYSNALRSDADVSV